MKKDHNNPLSFLVSSIVPLSITTIVICVVISSLNNDYYQENLQDYGEKDTSMNAPLSYVQTMKDIKYPDIEKPIYDLGDTRYNNKIFNREDEQQYSEFSVSRDLKYFNNATNLMLDNYFADNRMDTSSTPHDYLYDNSIQTAMPVYNFDHSVSQEQNIKPEDVYSNLLSYDDEKFPGLTKNAKYSSYYFEANFPDISNSVDKDFKYFNSVGSILSGGSLFGRQQS